MMYRPVTVAVLCFGIWMFLGVCRADAIKTTEPESDQQIGDFNLAGYGEHGKKTWDISGKTADIFADTVKLQQIVGNMYGATETIKLTAKKGDFDKKEGLVHLQDDVVITTATGGRLTTNSLDWDRKRNYVKTDEQVNIERQNMTTQAIGADGKTDLKQVTLEKDVQVNITPVDGNKPTGDINRTKITITCDGPLEIDYDKNVAVFLNNVKVDRQDSQIYSDRMEVYFTPGKSGAEKSAPGPADVTGGAMSSNIDKIVSTGNVKIVRGENVSYSDEALYTATDRKIKLIGKPKLIMYSTEDMKNASPGN